jgi:trk system potassium uptake protein TrkA
MKIIILGAGQVGASVAESLVSEANDITVVDTDARSISTTLQERLDLRTVTATRRRRRCCALPAPRMPTC